MKYIYSPKYSNARSGFTIIELLVAVAVTALMVSLMLTIVVNVLNGWNRSSGTLTSGNQARTVMDMITRDLQCIIMRSDSNVWLAATIQTNPTGDAWSNSGKPVTTSSSNTTDSSLYIPALPVIATPVNQPADLEDYRYGKGAMWLRLISNVADSNAAGDLTKISAPRAISYQIVRRKVTSAANAEERYLFYRSELPPTTTFTTGYNLLDILNYYSSGAGSALKTPAADSLIANNVVDFGVRFFTKRSTGELDPVFPYSAGGTTTLSFAATSDITKSGPGDDVSPIRKLPVVAEVFIRILTDEGVNQIALLEKSPTGYTAPGTWWEIVLSNSRVYTRRVEIKSSSL